MNNATNEILDLRILNAVDNDGDKYHSVDVSIVTNLNEHDNGLPVSIMAFRNADESPFFSIELSKEQAILLGQYLLLAKHVREPD